MAHPWSRPRREPEHGVLDVPTGENVRELGDIPAGAVRTKGRRFLRSGSTSELSDDDLQYLLDYGVRRVVDLRSVDECRRSPDRLSGVRGVAYLSQPLYDHNLRDDNIAFDVDGISWMARGYLTMFANEPAMREIFTFMAPATRNECVLFHCAAGMDRTGVLASVILGLCGVDRAHILADYAYSFVDPNQVDQIVFAGAPMGETDLQPLFDAIGPAYDRMVELHGSTYAYLRHCGVLGLDLQLVRHHLLG